MKILAVLAFVFLLSCSHKESGGTPEQQPKKGDTVASVAPKRENPYIILIKKNVAKIKEIEIGDRGDYCEALRLLAKLPDYVNDDESRKYAEKEDAEIRKGFEKFYNEYADARCNEWEHTYLTDAYETIQAEKAYNNNGNEIEKISGGGIIRKKERNVWIMERPYFVTVKVHKEWTYERKTVQYYRRLEWPEVVPCDENLIDNMRPIISVRNFK